MNAEKIKELCALGENSKVQFKLRVDNPSKIASEIIAFANYRGGTILVGVEDKTGEIVGLTYDQVQRAGRDVGNAATNHVRPTVYLQTETVKVDGKIILVVNVDEGSDKPYKDLSGNIWIKQGGDKRRVVENAEMLSLFQESGSFRPDEKGVRRTSLNDIDLLLVNEYLEKYYGKRVDEFGIPMEQLLQNLQIMTIDGRVTLAGLLFFGKHPQLFEPAFVIKAVSFFGNDMGGLEYRDSKDIMGTIPRMFDAGMAFLNANLHSLQAGQSFNSVGKLEISEIALKEILQNALVHRDYLIQAPIRIMIFDNRVEIVSPGGLPTGVDVESIRFGKTQQRNPLIATFCAKTMDYRGLGTGIIRAVKEADDIEFVNDDGAQFQVIMRRPVDSYDSSSQRNSFIVSEQTPYYYARRSPEHVGSSKDIRTLCPSLGKGEEENARRILAFCRIPQGILEMMEEVGYKSRTSFRRRVFTPLLEAGLLEPEYKDRPNSPKQRYRSSNY
ncbi:MAG: putative DNA binding domain-containing protein [Bacteroidales bacterium]|nr:putative DNA binding domain-containing protein [Bacteroidales bacterium]